MNILQILQNLHNFVKFQKNQLDNLIDFEKCCKTLLFLQRSAPIQPKTTELLPKFCQKIATTLPRTAGDTGPEELISKYREACRPCSRRGCSGLQISGSKFQSSKSISRELELTNLLGLVVGCIEAKICK